MPEKGGIVGCDPEGSNVGYRGHGKGEDERRLNGPVSGGVVTRGRADEEMPGFCHPHPQRKELPSGGHYGVLQDKEEGAGQSVACQHGEESGFGLGLIDPGCDGLQAVVTGEDQREPEEGEADASAFGLVEHAEDEGKGQGRGAAAAAGLDESERYGGGEGGQEIGGEGDGVRVEVGLEEGDEEAEEVVDGAQPGVAHVVRSWVWGALGRQEEAATGLVDVAE